RLHRSRQVPTRLRGAGQAVVATQRPSSAGASRGTPAPLLLTLVRGPVHYAVSGLPAAAAGGIAHLGVLLEHVRSEVYESARPVPRDCAGDEFGGLDRLCGEGREHAVRRVVSEEVAEVRVVDQ